MQKRHIGKGGPLVGAIGLGTMSLSGFYGPTTEDENRRCLATALDLGVDHLDTALIYGEGRAEEIVASFIKDHPGRFTLATKGGIDRGAERGINNSPEFLRQCLETSLKRLGVDHVELYYVHRREAAIPVEDVMETLVRFKEEGKIGGIGLSEISPATLERAHAVHPVMAVQNEYSLWTRMPELGLLQAAERLGTALVAFSPLARGLFTSVDIDRDSLPDREFRKNNPRFIEPNFSHNMRYVERFRAYAAERGHSPAALALAWVLHRSPATIPIPGTRSAEHLRELAAGAAINLSTSNMAEIEEILPVGWAHGDRYTDQQWVGPERYC